MSRAGLSCRFSLSDDIFALVLAHAVASGDPYDYSVLLWTRAEPTAVAPVDIPVCVTYKVFAGQDGTVSVRHHSVRRLLPNSESVHFLGLGRRKWSRLYLLRRRLYRQGRSHRLGSVDPLLVPIRQLCQAGASLTYWEDEDRSGQEGERDPYPKVCGLFVCQLAERVLQRL